MARFEFWQDLDMDNLPKVEVLNGVIFTADSGANQLGVRVTKGGQSVTLSGTVRGFVIKPDGTMVNDISGTRSGNTASIVLPAAAYTVPGMARVIIKLLVSGAETTTLGAWDIFVASSAT